MLSYLVVCHCLSRVDTVGVSGHDWPNDFGPFITILLPVEQWIHSYKDQKSPQNVFWIWSIFLLIFFSPCEIWQNMSFRIECHCWTFQWLVLCHGPCKTSTTWFTLIEMRVKILDSRCRVWVRWVETLRLSLNCGLAGSLETEPSEEATYLRKGKIK